MPENGFEQIEAVLGPGRSVDGEAVFELLIRRFEEEKQYGRMFDARLMQHRHRLGLPLLASGALDQLPESSRAQYEQTLRKAARETGELYLQEGEIARAWPYFRAMGEPGPVAEAIAGLTRVETTEELEPILEIALHERVNPKKGFELLLRHHGICRAITFFDQYPDPGTREACLHILVEDLYTELTDRLKRTITQVEGKEPEQTSVTGLLDGRDWLFGEYDAYVDTSHLVSVLRFCLESNDRETLARAVELAGYGKHLGPIYQQKGEPPLEDVFVDHAIFLQALVGNDVEEAVAHFRNKLGRYDPEQIGTYPAQVVVRLLIRLHRFREAIEVFREYLRETPAAYLSCPGLLELCQMAGDMGALKEVAREQGDLLVYAAAALQSS